MATASASIFLPLQPWTNAKNRFLDSLPDGADRTIFEEATLENIFYSSSAGFQNHMATSKLNRASKKLKPLLESIEGYGKAIDVLAQSSATILCPLWGSMRIVLHLALSYQKYYDKLLEMYERIGDVLPRFRSYQALFPKDPYLLAYLTDAYFEIVTFSYDASQVFVLQKDASSKKHEATVKLRWKPFKSRFEECIDKLRRATENVREQAEIAHMKASKAFMIESRKNQDLVLADRSLQKYQDDFRRIRDLLSTYDYREKHHRVRALRCEGTCQWFLKNETVQTWFQSQSAEPLTCFGIPGSGKTIVASAVIDAVIEDTMPRSIKKPDIVCYHYCDYADSQSLDATIVLASLTRQLLDLHSSCAKSIFERCRDALATGFSISLADVLFCFREALKSTRDVLIVIDGVDELETLAQDALLPELLNIARQRPDAFRTIIFGRRDERMVKRHQLCQHEINIGLDDNAGDLQRYIGTQMQLCIDRGELMLRDEFVAELIVDRLIAGAEQMFLWVRFQIEELCYAGSDEAILEILDDLPRTISETYDRILCRISRKPRGRELLETARRVLPWIIAARRPLTVAELGEAAAIQPGDTHLLRQRIVHNDMHILEACSNFVVHAADGTVLLAHHTVQEYFVQIAPSVRNEIVFSTWTWPMDANCIVTTACLTYLLFSDFETQITKSSRDNLSMPTSMMGTRLALSAGSARHSALMPLVASIRGLKDGSEKTTKLRLPPRRHPQGQIPTDEYLMLNYIASNWHWHAQRQFSRNSDDSTLDVSLLSKVIFRASSVVAYRPWWTPNYRPEDPSQSRDFEAKLFDWSIGMDYTVMLDAHEKYSKCGPLWPKSTTATIAVPNPESIDLAYVSACRKACDAKSELFMLSLATRYAEKYDELDLPMSPVATLSWIDALRFMTSDGFNTWAVMLKLWTYVGIPAVRAELTSILCSHDQSSMLKLLAYCSHIGKLDDLRPLRTAVIQNDAASVAAICEWLIQFPYAQWPRKDWSYAIQKCFAGRKSQCMRAMIVLHETRVRSYLGSFEMKTWREFLGDPDFCRDRSLDTRLMTELRRCSYYDPLWFAEVFDRLGPCFPCKVSSEPSKSELARTHGQPAHTRLQLFTPSDDHVVNSPEEKPGLIVHERPRTISLSRWLRRRSFDIESLPPQLLPYRRFNGETDSNASTITPANSSPNTPELMPKSRAHTSTLEYDIPDLDSWSTRSVLLPDDNLSESAFQEHSSENFMPPRPPATPPPR